MEGMESQQDSSREALLEFGLDSDLAFLPEWARHPTEAIRILKEPAPVRRGHKRGEPRRRERPVPSARPVPLRKPEKAPDVEVRLVPDAKGIEGLVKQIRLTGRAYPVLDIARLILQRPERYMIALTVKHTDGRDERSLWVCTIDGSVWLTDDELVDYVLEKHFDAFYKTEKIPQDPPKGVYTFVAQCGLSGEILGPPNHHQYQKRLQELHAKRFSYMPFEEYKARVRIIRDEEAVKRWIEMMSYREEYEALNVPEPVRLKSRAEVEKHFREVHLLNISARLDRVTIPGDEASWPPLSPILARWIRRQLDRELEFPDTLFRSLCDQFAAHGLHFFKVDERYLHVCVANPRPLDLENTVVSDRIRNIIEFIQTHPGCTRKDLLLALAPSPALMAQIEGSQTGVVSAEPTEEQKQVIADLYWLVHQGHVIEYTTGKLELPKGGDERGSREGRSKARRRRRIGERMGQKEKEQQTGDIGPETQEIRPEEQKPAVSAEGEQSATEATGDEAVEEQQTDRPADREAGSELQGSVTPCSESTSLEGEKDSASGQDLSSSPSVESEGKSDAADGECTLEQADESAPPDRVNL